MKELDILDMSVMLEGNIELAKQIYEKFVEPLKKKAEEKYESRKERLFDILRISNEQLNVCHRYLSDSLKDKDEHIKKLEAIIKTRIVEQAGDDRQDASRTGDAQG